MALLLGCLCGAVRFRITAEPSDPVRCLCPRCRGRGIWQHYVPAADVELLTGRDHLTEPMDHAQRPQHLHCRTCGEPSFGLAGPNIAVNAVTLARARAREAGED